MMNETPVFRTIALNGGLTLQVVDHSNRYFGDYHRIKLVISCELPLTAASIPEAWRERAAEVRERLGESLHFERSMERMGVAGDAVAAVKEEMLASFLTSTGHYLARPAFVARLVADKLGKKDTSQRRFTLIK
ncbi:MAG: hypothetical protein P1P74_00030 [Desulfuromonadales bacterium]|nr:hypothetical protein [Desulfuromonadales bacterium]